MTISDCSVQIESDSGNTPILENINISIPRNKVSSIIGHSGAGKSFLCRLLACLVPNQSNIRVSGEIIYHKSDGSSINLLQLSEANQVSYRKNHVSYVFQNAGAALNPSMSCGKQIIEAIKLTGLTEKAAVNAKLTQLLQEVQLVDETRIAKSYPHQISGGQQQRIMIAMALAKNPSILIADEPTSSLDQRTENEIIKLLQNIQKDRAMTLLFVSHDLQMVQHLSDYIIVMNRGRVVEQSSAAELFSNPKDEFTKSFLINIEGIPKVFEPAHEILLDIKNVSKKFNRQSLFFSSGATVQALDNISLQIKKGEIIGLVGASGSGKSTLAKLLMNLETQDKGDIEFCGSSLQNRWKNERQLMSLEIQIIFQNPLLSWTPSMTVGRALIEVASLNKDQSTKQEKITSLLEQVGLSKVLLDRYPHQVSGGELQRLSIVRSLLLDPKLLICDECVSSLDPESKHAILKILSLLNKDQKISILFISHDIKTVQSLCHRVLYIENGRLLE